MTIARFWYPCDFSFASKPCALSLQFGMVFASLSDMRLSAKLLENMPANIRVWPVAPGPHPPFLTPQTYPSSDDVFKLDPNEVLRDRF